MTSMTVTATQSDSSSNRCALAVRVLTGANGVGRKVESNVFGALAVEITPQGNGSIVYGGLQTVINYAAYPSIVYSSDTTVISDSTESTSGYPAEGLTFKSTNPTTAESPVTLGFDNTGRTSYYTDLCLLEILSDGSLAEDSSTPAVVLPTGGGNFSSAVSRTTDSFDPPSGAMLVAIGVSKAAIGTPPPNAPLDISDSESLSWTQQATNSVSGGGIVTIWTATLPGAPTIAYPSCIAASASAGSPSVTATGLVLASCVGYSASVPVPWAGHAAAWGYISVGEGQAPDAVVSEYRVPV